MIKKPSFKTAMIIMTTSMIAFYAAGTSLVFNGVKNRAVAAQLAYPGSAVDALIALVQDESAPFEDRNRAIWALGQIGNTRALPTLRALDTDEIQTAPYRATEEILQYAVEKAIKQTRSFSTTRWIYRFL